MIRIIQILFIFWLTLCGVCYSAPVITGDSNSGVISNGTSITFQVTDPGDTGPNPPVYDEIEGVNGNDVSLNATVGTWSEYGAFTPKYSSLYAHSGNTSMDAVVGEKSQQLRKIYTAGTEVLIAYWTFIPSDKYFPGATELLTRASSSSWKHVWLRQDGPAGDINDFINISWSDGTWWSCGGNSIPFGDSGRIARYPEQLPTYESIQVWGSWYRTLSYSKAGVIPQIDTGIIYTQTISSARGMFERTITDVVLFAGGTVPYNRNNMYIPGWQKGDDTVDAFETKIFIDDITFVEGAGAAARVEVGSGTDTTYANHSNLSICTVEAWGTNLQVKIRQKAVPDGPAVIFVTDKNNETSVGYLVTLEATPPTSSGTVGGATINANFR